MFDVRVAHPPPAPAPGGETIVWHRLIWMSPSSFFRLLFFFCKRTVPAFDSFVGRVFKGLIFFLGEKFWCRFSVPISTPFRLVRRRTKKEERKRQKKKKKEMAAVVVMMEEEERRAKASATLTNRRAGRRH